MLTWMIDRRAVQLTPHSDHVTLPLCPGCAPVLVAQAEAGIAKLDDPAKAEAEEEDGSKWVYDMHMVSGQSWRVV